MTLSEAADRIAALTAERDALRRDNAFLGYVIHGPLQPEQEARAVKVERDALRSANERLRAPCGELLALYDNGLLACAGTVPRVIEEIRAALERGVRP